MRNGAMEPLRKRSNDDFEMDEKEKKSPKFLQISSVHGLKHLSYGNACHRILWSFLVLTAAGFMSVALLYSSVGPETMVKAPIHEIPFPALTICPETKSQKSMADFSSAYHMLQAESNETLGEIELSRIEALTQVCDSHMLAATNINDPPTAGEEFVEILREIAVQQSNMLLFCKFRNKLSNCSEVFKEVITDEGICYTFNGEDIFKFDESAGETSWTREAGYSSDPDSNNYPKKALANFNFGFNIVLSVASSDRDFLCKGPVQGFKARIHAPDELPSMADGFFRIPHKFEVIASVEAQVVENFENCHRSATRSLRFFRKYSQQSCIAECLSEHVKSVCECVKFSMVHDNTTKVCTQHETQCMEDATHTFFTSNRLEQEYPCDCKPACVDYKYSSHETLASYDFEGVFNAHNISQDDEFPEALMSRLVVYLKNDFYTRKTINDGRIANLVSRLSQIGGIMAFFLGASILSAIELIYFLIKWPLI